MISSNLVGISDGLGTTRPQVSELKHGKFDRLAAGRLMVLLAALGCDLELRVTPAPRKRMGRFTAKAA